MRLNDYAARNIPVLFLNRRPDPQGDVFPPECHVTFNNPVLIVYEYDYTKVIGKAYLMKSQDKIIADLHIVSSIQDEDEAKSLMQRMYPAISARINVRHQNIVLGLDITAISLGFNKNICEAITPLGNQVSRIRKAVR